MISGIFNRIISPIGFDLADMRMLWSFFRMNVQERYLGSVLGIVWAVANPVMMLGIFTFVFGFVFQSKLPGSETSLSFVIWLISGYGPWLAIAEGLNNSTSSVVSNASLIKNLKFKTELIPMAGGLTGLIPLVVSIIYLTIILAFDFRAPGLAWLVMLPYLFMQFAFVIGIGLMLATVNVFIRDVQMALPNVLLAIMFASPIFYPISSFPYAVRKVMAYNPFYLLAEGYRQPLLYDSTPPLGDALYLLAISVGIFLLGLFVFRRYKNFFDADL